MHLTGQVMNYMSKFEALYMKHSYVERGCVRSCTFPAATHFVTSSIIHIHFVNFQYFKVASLPSVFLIDKEIHCQLFFMIGWPSI